MAEPRDSYGRCLSNRQFFDRFYERFLDSHPSIQPFFEKTDFVRQKSVIRHMLTTVVMFDTGNEIAQLALERTARQHGPNGLAIPKDLYDNWLECMVETVRECDPKFGPDVEEAWRRVIQNAVAFILKTGYDA